MACDIVKTAGAADADSYADISDGDAYHAAHTAYDTWDGYSDEQQCRALKMATRLLDQWFVWHGDVAYSGQALLWPRDGVIGPNGYEEDSSAIPRLIVEATCELARQLIMADRTADSDMEAQKLTRVKAGAVEVEFKGTAVAKPIPDAVAIMVAPYVDYTRGRSSGAVTVQRA